MEKTVERTCKPTHPGEVLRTLYMEPLGLTITGTAAHIGVSRKTLSAIVNGRASVTADIALRLSRAFNTTPDVWLNMQWATDIWEARQKNSTWMTIRPFTVPEMA